MVDGVAHQVEQRLLYLGRDAAVEARLLAGDGHLDVAAERLRQLPAVPGQRLQVGAERLHLQRLQLFDLTLGHPPQTALALGQLRREAAQGGGEARDHLLWVRMAGALLGQPHEPGEAIHEQAGAGGEDAQPRGAIGERFERRGVEADLGGGGGRPEAVGPGRRDGVAGGRRRRARRLASGHLVDHGAERVDCSGQGVGGAGPGELQRSLGGVTQVGDGREAEHAAGALDRVQLAACLGGGRGVGRDARRQRREPLQAGARLAGEQRHEVGELSVHERKARGDRREARG